MTRRLLTATLFPTSILFLLTCSAFSIGPPATKLTKAQKRVDRTIAVLAQMTDADSLAAAGYDPNPPAQP